MLYLAENSNRYFISHKVIHKKFNLDWTKCSFNFIFHMVHKVRVNLPNSDMVGHTGDIKATVVACKAADEAVKVL